MFAPRVAEPKTAPPHHSAVAPERPGQTAVAHWQMLQRTIGNQAVLRLLAQRASATRNEPGAPENEHTAAPVTGREPGPSWDFSKIPVFPPDRAERSPMPPLPPAPRLPGPLQAKLEVGAVDDPLERDADQVADQVMRMPTDRLSVAVAPLRISGKCAECEEDANLQKKPAGSEPAAGDAPGSVHQVLRSPGQPLDAQTRAYFAPRFGHDFGGVRVHSGAAAEQSARDVNATAYTVGHNTVFNSGRFAPGTYEGRRLLAHELTHVVQQGFGTRQGAVQLKQNAPGAGGKAAADPLAARQEALMAVGVVENNWKILAAVAAPYGMLKPWVAHGDAIVAMLRTHTNGALDAIRAGDSELAAAYTLAAKTDKITYDFIAWHVTAYANLLSVRSSIYKLIEAFDHDPHRGFTGGKTAERIARELKKAIDGLQASSDGDVALIRRDIALGVRSGTPRQVTITVTSPALDPKVQQVFENLTAGMMKLQANVQQGVDFVNQFVDQAHWEGAEQAVEALEEYYKVKEILGGRSKKPGKKKSEKEQTKPDVAPVPLTPVEEEESKLPAAMRFQVQWNSRAKDPGKKGQFSGTATAPASLGVTTVQAVAALTATHAKVAPDRAKKAAAPAVASQTNWIIKRPPAGIAVGGYSRSERFDYDYPDARVDVENLRGHNLRK